MDIMNDMIIDLIILLFLILLILFVTDFKLSSDKILNFWIKKGLESGIKEIEYPSSHRISIYFNDDIYRDFKRLNIPFSFEEEM